MSLPRKEKITDEHLGMLAIKKRGFFSGLAGVIVKSEYPTAGFNYVLEFGSGSRVAVNFLDEIELHGTVEALEDAQNKNNYA